MQDECNDQVQAWSSQLDPVSRHVIVLRYWYDLSYEEMAQAIGGTIGAIKSRLHHARGSLARHILARQVESTLRGRSDKSAAQHFSMVI